MAFSLPIGDLGPALTAVGNINLGDIASQAAMGLVVTGAVAGLKSPDVQDRVDFLHLFHKDGSQTVSSPTGKTISAAALKALDPATQAKMIDAGYTVIG